MLEYVPVRFDLYRTVRPCLRWTLQCLVSFADRAGKCWPSVRTLAKHAGIGKSTAARHLAELATAKIVTRSRRRGGVYAYHVDSRFLPATVKVSHKPPVAVPHRPTKEQVEKQTERFAPFMDEDRWPQRLGSWRKSRFWLPQWGPKPGEPGCWAPVIPA